MKLYELIKQKSQEKNRPLKVIADWDDVIQAFKPVAVYELRKLPKFKDKVEKDFSKFLERFWEISITGGSLISDGKIKGVEDATELERELFDEYTKMVNLRRGGLTDYDKSFYSSPEWISTITNAPLLSPAKDLLKALKEDLIERLIIISSYRKGREKGQGVTRKKKNFPKFFGRFSQCELELTKLERNEQREWVPPRWQRIKEICPDFDIFIDDNTRIINETIKNIPDKERTYVLPDYKQCRGIQSAPNIYHVKVSVSDLQDEDFVKAAEEYKQKQAAKSALAVSPTSNQERERERQVFEQPLFYVGLIGGAILLGLGIYWLVRKKTKKN